MNSLLKSFFLILVFLGLVNGGHSQCLGTDMPFKTGEHLHYDVYYHWKAVWVNAGLVDFRVGVKEYEDQFVHHFSAIGSSKPRWDWIFTVRDTFETLATYREIKPLWFRRRTREGDYQVNNLYTFDRASLKASADMWNSEDGHKDTVIVAKDCGMDVLSSIYNCRRIDFNTLQVDEKVPLRMIVSGEVYDLYVRYLGLEETKLRTGERYRCRKFSILLVEGTIFEGGEDMIVWVTDDENKIPVKVAAKILVGQVEAHLVSYSELKHAMGARIP